MATDWDDRFSSVEVFIDEAGEFRWRAVAKNSQIVAVSGEGFEHKQYAHEAAAKFLVVDPTFISEVEN